MNVTNWITAISSALTVIITLVYVIATIRISRSNKESAEASRKQIEESQKQQKQNVGLQLYALRKEAINKISQKQYNEVFWDIPLLFNDNLFSEFQRVAFKAGHIEELQKPIDQFEAELGVLVGIHAMEHVKKVRKSLVPHDDVTPLRDCLSQELSRLNKDVSKSVDEYLGQVAEIKELEFQHGAENVQLIFKLREFVKKSIE